MVGIHIRSAGGLAAARGSTLLWSDCFWSEFILDRGESNTRQSTVKRIWHIKDSQGQILALAVAWIDPALGFRVQGSGFRVQGSGFRAQGSGFRVQGSGFGVWGSETRKVDIRLPGKGNSNSHAARPVHRIIKMIKWTRTSRLSIKNSLSGVQGSGLGVQGSGFRVWGSGFGVWGLGFRV